jgi:MFS transporter, DHA1 family, tetracycline resistance protein
MPKLASKNPLLVSLLTVFIDLVGFGILIPILPVLFLKPLSPNYLLPSNTDTHTALILYGLLLGFFPLAQFLATPIFGQLSDLYGRRKILILSLIGSAVSYAIFAFGVMIANLPLLFLARFFGGLTGGNIAVAQAIVGDVSEEKNKTKNFGLIGGAFGLGFILGPFIGGHLGGTVFGSSFPFWMVALFSVFNFVFVYFFLPETHLITLDNRRVKIDWTKSFTEIKQAFSIPSLKVILLMSFLFQAGFSFLTTFCNPFFIERFGWGEEMIGNFFGYIGIWIAISQVVLLRFFSKHSERKVLNYSLILSSVFAGFLLVPTNQLWLLFLAPLFAVFIGLATANITAIVSKSADPKKQGEVMGINSSIQALAQAIPPILSGFLTFGGSVSLPIWISVIVMASSGIIFVRYYRPNV